MSRLIFAIIMLFVTVACGGDEVRLEESVFSDYVKLPVGSLSSAYEVVTLPVDSGSAADYMVVIAEAKYSEVSASEVMDALPVYTGAQQMQMQFVRPWLHGESRQALIRFADGDYRGVIRDASSWSIIPVRRAVAIDSGNGRIAMYFEYVVPSEGVSATESALRLNE